MAGSYQHAITKSGKLRNNESFVSMVENLGDAYETAEEMYGMIQFLAEELAQCTGVPRRELIELAGQHYQDGLRIGGRQRDLLTGVKYCRRLPSTRKEASP